MKVYNIANGVELKDVTADGDDDDDDEVYDRTGIIKIRPDPTF